MPLGLEVLGRAFANRFRRGLYGGKRILYGNKISEDGGNKTRRRWLPNAQYKKLYSEALDCSVQLRVTTHALRCIDKCGGLDNYLLSPSNKKVLEESDVAMELKNKIQTILRRKQKLEQKQQSEQSMQ